MDTNQIEAFGDALYVITSYSIHYTKLYEFMQEWSKETSRWADAVLKVAVAESEHNKTLIAGWVEKWRGKVSEVV